MIGISLAIQAKGDIGLDAAKLPERGCGNLGLASHAGRGGEDAVRADEIGALADPLARQPHCLVVVASEKLGV